MDDHAIVIFMDMKSHLIFDKVIVSCDGKCGGKIKDLVDDFDINTAPFFQPDDSR